MTTVLDGGTAAHSAILEARCISKTFGGLTALDEVDFQVAPGEIVGLIGPNGSGKSTLLNCMSRLDAVSSGTILLDGEDVTHEKPHFMARRGMTRTFQTARVFADLTAFENALLGRQWRGVRWREMAQAANSSVKDRARFLLHMVGLESLGAEYAGNLSGGQRRLLELVIAMMPQPRVVLLDEATSGVNPSLVRVMGEYIQRLSQEEGTAFVIVEHNLALVLSVSDRLVVLYQGRELAEGSPETVIRESEVMSVYLGS